MTFQYNWRNILLVVVTMCMTCTRIIREEDLFYPRHFPVLSDEILRTNVTIELGDSIALRGWYLHSANHTQSLIYFCGNGEYVYTSEVRLYWLAANLRCDVLAVDYRGYGSSDGKPSFNSLLTDGVEIYDYLMDSVKQSHESTFIYGRSLGAIPAVYVASQKPISGLILEAPPTSAAEIIPRWKSFLPWYVRLFVSIRPDSVLESYEPQPIDNIRSVTAPLLIIHGTADKLVPIDVGRRLFEEAGSKQKHWVAVEGSGHNDLRIYDRPNLIRFIHL